MGQIQRFSPEWASPPGETIADILHERDISEADFAQRLGQTIDQAVELLHGRATITLRTARALSRVLGASPEFWMSRDYQYREDVARPEVALHEWLRELPISDMISFGWLKPLPLPSEEALACLRFFDVPSVDAWRHIYSDVHKTAVFRTSPTFDSNPGAVAAWLRQGAIEAGSVETGPWNPQLLRDALPKLRSLTRRSDPSRFLPELVAICAECGVAVIVLRAPNGCRASGATQFLTPDKALLLLSFRYLTDDHFWFSFFHEIGHLLLHGNNGLILEGLAEVKNDAEDEANEFAARTLIPAEHLETLLGLRRVSREIMRFAASIGISSGIVVGQLQHRGMIGHGQLNSLKRRFVWDDQRRRLIRGRLETG